MPSTCSSSSADERARYPPNRPARLAHLVAPCLHDPEICEITRRFVRAAGTLVLVVCPGLTQTNFSKNMLERKALVQLDHLRGMTAERVAEHILKSIAKGKNEVCLTFQGKLLVLVSRFFPRLADFISKRKVRSVFQKKADAETKIDNGA